MAVKTVLLRVTNPLGDAIAIMPYFEKYAMESEHDVYVHLGNDAYYDFFKKSYPNIQFTKIIINADEEIIVNGGGLMDKPFQAGMAEQLGYKDAPYIRPKCDSVNGERPIKGKYAVISIQSTAQAKYWNHPDGKKVQPDSPYWNELCHKLRKAGITPVLIEKHELFGTSPYWNGPPKKANKKIGLSFPEIVNYLEHAEFFIGLSSGLAWLAHALGTKVAMIANFTEDYHEFDLGLEDYIRITNKSVCHGCWQKIGTDFRFDPNDWYWCPLHKDTDRQFECHTSITPDQVFDSIKKWIE